MAHQPHKLQPFCKQQLAMLTPVSTLALPQGAAIQEQAGTALQHLQSCLSHHRAGPLPRTSLSWDCTRHQMLPTQAWQPCQGWEMLAWHHQLHRV